MNKLITLCFCLLALAGLSSCESDDQTTISAAQSCLDKATSSTVSSCVTMLGSLTSQDAYLIRCSAHYIKQGFTTTRFVNAYNLLKSNSGSSSNALSSSLSFMSFNSLTGTDGANQAVTDCQNANVKSMYRLAVLTQMATIITSSANLASSYDPNSGYTSAQVTSAITNFVSNGGDPTTLGNTAIAANQAYCSTGSSFSGTSVCTTLSAAVSGGQSASQIGSSLLSQLQK